MDLLLNALLIFIVIVLVIEGVSYGLRAVHNPELKRVKKELRVTSGEMALDQYVDIGRKRPLSNIPWFNRMLLSIRAPMVQKLDRLLQQSDTQYPLGVFILLSLSLSMIGLLIAFLVSRNFLVSLPAGAIIGLSPLFFIMLKKNRRIRTFEQQLPDALDLVGRALRAGQSFSGGLQMVAEEFNDPIGGEFGKTLTQINLGVSQPDALRSLSERIECPDLKFFVISVIIQRQSGGNLAEILENISYLIRERFKLRGRVRALAAEGKFSAMILIALPFFIVTVLSIMSPAYVSVLITDHIGRIMIVLCLVMMCIGVLVMKKIITIKV